MRLRKAVHRALERWRDLAVLLLLVVPIVVSIAALRAATTASDAKTTADASAAVTCEQAKVSENTARRFESSATFIRSFQDDPSIEQAENPEAARQFLEIIAGLADEVAAGAAARAAATEEACGG